MHRLLIAASLALTACASGGASNAPTSTMGTPDPSAANHSDPNVTCNDEVRTGTMLEKKICRSEAEKAQERRAAEDMYNMPRRTPRL